jgi:hypothetical protein
MELLSFRAIAASAVCFADLQIADKIATRGAGIFEGSWLYRAMHRTRMIRRKSHRACAHYRHTSHLLLQIANRGALLLCKI